MSNILLSQGRFTIMYKIIFKNFYGLVFLERREGRKRERETSTCCSTFSCLHWLILVGALTPDGTHDLGVSGQYSNLLSCLARVKVLFNLVLTYLYRDIAGQQADLFVSLLWQWNLSLYHFFFQGLTPLSLCLSSNQFQSLVILCEVFHENFLQKVLETQLRLTVLIPLIEPYYLQSYYFILYKFFLCGISYLPQITSGFHLKCSLSNIFYYDPQQEIYVTIYYSNTETHTQN